MKFEHDQVNPRQFQYNCAFHNDAARDEAPRMIRITIKIDDPGNRLQNGQWYQYVLTR
jgi:hypothetical protein